MHNGNSTCKLQFAFMHPGESPLSWNRTASELHGIYLRVKLTDRRQICFALQAICSLACVAMGTPNGNRALTHNSFVIRASPANMHHVFGKKLYFLCEQVITQNCGQHATHVSATWTKALRSIIDIVSCKANIFGDESLRGRQFSNRFVEFYTSVLTEGPHQWASSIRACKKKDAQSF